MILLRSLVWRFISRGQEHFGLGEILTILRNNLDLAKGNVNVERRWKVFREGKNV